jgi:hypothetical protein
MVGRIARRVYILSYGHFNYQSVVAKKFARGKTPTQMPLYALNNLSIQAIQRLCAPIPETRLPGSQGEGEAREKDSGGRPSKEKMGWSNAMALPQSGLGSAKKMGL